MSAPDGFLAGAATGAAPGTASTVVRARSGPSTLSPLAIIRKRSLLDGGRRLLSAR